MTTDNPELHQNPIPDLGVVSGAYREILKHNSTHTGFGAAFRGIIGHIMREEGHPQADEIPDPEQVRANGDMDAELQDIFHSDTFMRTGIRVEPSGSFVSNGEGQATTSTELVPRIENTSLFTEFLSGLTPEAVQQDETARQLLNDVVVHLAKISSVCFDPEQTRGIPEEQRAQLAEVGEDALRTFLAIDPEYARLGVDGAAYRGRVEGISEELSAFLNSGQGGVVPTELGDEYRRHIENQARMRVYEGMSNRVHYWGRNLLPEYLVAQGGQYLTPPEEQGFGPSDWQKDGGQYHWQQAFDFLGRLVSDERTQPFADEVRQGLVRSLDAALAEADDTTKDVYWKSQRPDLANIRNALTGQDYNPAQLATYIKKPDWY